MSDDPPAALRPELRAKEHAGWMAASQGWSLILTISSAMILARLLTPDDFGLFAVATPLMVFAHQIQDMGFTSAIVQARTLDKRQLDALFWFALGVSLALTILTVSAAPLIARLLHDSRLSAILSVCSLSIIATTLAAQPNALLSRDMRFRVIALRNIAATGLATAASIAVAAMTHSYWALAVSMILVPLFNFAISVKPARWRPGIPRRGAGTEALIGFGFHLSGANLLNFASRNADNLIVAYATSPRELGIYDRAYRILLYPINQALLPLGQVMIPMLSRCREDPEKFRRHYWSAVILIHLLCLPGLVIAMIFPETVIGMLLGPRWLEGASLFGWFASAALFQIYLGTTNWLLIGQGRGREYLHVGLLTSGVALVSFLIGIGWGIRGVALAYVLGQAIVCLPFQLWIVGRRGHVQHREIAVRLISHVCALGFVCALIATFRWNLGSPRMPMLIAETVAAYATFASVILAFSSNRLLIRGAIQNPRP